jgi:ABC-type uncharacterized transport system substrate-binding protein
MIFECKIRIPLKFILSIGTAILLVFLGSVSLSARQFVVLKSQDLGPYNETVNGILSSAKNPPQVFSLSGDPEKISQVSAMLSSPPDLFIAIGTQSAAAIRSAFPQSSMVFAMVPRARGQAMVDRKTSGIYLDLTFENQLKLIQRMLPKTQRIGIILSEDNQLVDERDLLRKGQEVGITIVIRRTPDVSRFSDVLSTIIDQIDLFLILPDPLWGQKDTVMYLREKLVDKNIPFVAFSQSLVKIGAVMAFCPDYAKLGRQLGEILDNFAAGEPLKAPADPPFRVIVNRTLMNQYGVVIPSQISDKVDYQ